MAIGTLIFLLKYAIWLDERLAYPFNSPVCVIYFNIFYYNGLM